MVSVNTALSLIEEYSVSKAVTESVDIAFAVGRVLSDNVYSPIDMPPFRQSAMDGYALNLSSGNDYCLVGEIRAGSSHTPNLKKGEAVRIFTGAPVPETANSVVMQEKVTLSKDLVQVENNISKNLNIRPQGEQITTGDIALEKGHKLTVSGVGFLASIGVKTVKVVAKPTISIVITGDELQPLGEPLPYGKIYESNSMMLMSALKQLGCSPIVYKAKDDFIETKKTIEQAISKSDIVLITGGISVGDYDFSGKALNDIGIKTAFYKVKQKPGKPLYYGITNTNKPIFALPGNPASVLTCFYVYVYPLLQKWEGNKNNHLKAVAMPSLSEFQKREGYTQFLKATIDKDGITILEGQNSAMLHTFAKANALAVILEEKENINKGDIVNALVLPL